jgi:hypothetical protein
MEAMVAIRARIEANWRLVKMVVMRAASPRRDMQAMPLRKKHDVNLEIALLNRVSGAGWREVSMSCNSKRNYNMPVSI